MLRDRVAPLCRDPLPVADLCLFTQPEEAAPFRLSARFPLAEASAGASG